MTSSEPAGRRIGYARVSTADQYLEIQVRALTAAGVGSSAIYAEHVSGTKADRVELGHAIRALRPDDQLVVTKLDRLTRSLKHLLELVDQIEAAGASLVVLDQAVDTSTPAGRLFMQVVGAVAEFERALIAERTRQALVGRPRGRRGGRPRVLTGKRLQRAIDLDQAGGMTLAEIASTVGVGRSTLKRELAQHAAASQLSRTNPREEDDDAEGHETLRIIASHSSRD